MSVDLNVLAWILQADAEVANVGPVTLGFQTEHRWAGSPTTAQTDRSISPPPALSQSLCERPCRDAVDGGNIDALVAQRYPPFALM